jgi:hypothetical protein
MESGSTKKTYPTYLSSILYVSGTVGKLYVNLMEGTIIETETIKYRLEQFLVKQSCCGP